MGIISKSKQTGRYGRKKKKTVSMSESALQKFTNEYLTLCGLYYVRIPDGAYKTGRIEGGIPDNVVMIPIGKEYCLVKNVELKTRSQLHGQQIHNAHDFNWFIARTPEDVIDVVEKLTKQAEKCNKCMKGVDI